MPKTIYKIGEKFDASGLELLLRNSDETTERVKYTADNVNDFTFKPSQDEALKLEDKKVTVTYKGKEAVIDIVVEEDKPQNNGNAGSSAPVVPAVPDAANQTPAAKTPETGTVTTPETATEKTEDITPEGTVKETAFTKLLSKLNKTNKIKAKAIQKKVNRKKGLTLEQFAKELVNKKVITKVTGKDAKKLLKGVKTSKWAKTYIAALVKTGLLKKSDLKNTKKKISEDYVAKILEKLMIKNKKAKK